jgi:putative Ca2+/H+ antiporter (TMEM165/GDT1 family)
MMQPLLLAIGSDIAAEIGDKSQVLIFLLALRLAKPLPVVLGMLVATGLTHAMAGAAGLWVAAALDPALVHVGLGGLFVAIGLWTMFPRLADRFTIVRGGSAFLTSALSYFVAETGGKTYIMTAAISAQTGSWTAVVVGTLIGEVLINAPLVVLGGRLAQRLEARQVDLRWVYRLAGAALAAMGLAQLLGIDLF